MKGISQFTDNVTLFVKFLLERGMIVIKHKIGAI